jgi:hypothetical protein
MGGVDEQRRIDEAQPKFRKTEQRQVFTTRRQNFELSDWLVRQVR